MKKIVAVAALCVAASDIAAADLAVQTRIRHEGFRNSKVMEIARELTDGIGPRLTGSPNMAKANAWTREKLTEFGLSNARTEQWGPFGRGWSSDQWSLRMTAPATQQLYAIPMAWTPGTNGVIRGKAVKAKLESEEDLEKHRGKLAGAIVLSAEPGEMKPQERAALDRYDAAELEEIATYEVPRLREDEARAAYRKRLAFRRQLVEFATEEKIAAILAPGRGEGGVFRVQSGGSWREGEPAGVPSLGVAPEHYARIARLLDSGNDVELELDIRAQFHDEDKHAYNTIAEIPGSGRSGEVVMMGAHLDSWHTGTGATDNASGVAAMMEAARILRSLGITPRRTIRIALWSGEEQGLLGSRGYVSRHFAEREAPKDPEQAKLPLGARTEKGELEIKPAHAKISAYFNMDNGTGRIRGIYAQENAAAVPIFESWLAPVKDLGATTVTMRNTTSTDHIPFDEVGIPGFQFIQDSVEYFTRTHHTNWDTFERLQREDLMQAAVVIATVVWEAANAPQMVPRK